MKFLRTLRGIERSEASSPHINLQQMVKADGTRPTNATFRAATMYDTALMPRHTMTARRTLVRILSVPAKYFFKDNISQSDTT
jgi:hypothetical protein